jgi:dolichol-phosphate mannosyltransferase
MRGNTMSETPRPTTAHVRSDSVVVVPTYNEAENLERLVELVLAQGPFDLLIVDDHSPDGTGELADRLAARHPERVAVLHRARKQGLGTAYRAGFARALAHGYPHVFEMDADFSHDPRALPGLRAALDEADMVLGSRYVPGGSTQDWPFARRLLSQAGSKYAAVLLGLPLHDLTGGFKGFRSRVLQSLDLEAIRSNGYAFQIEVTYRAYRAGFHIVERPITFVDRRLGKSKMRPSIVSEALRIVWTLRFGPAAPAVQDARP